MAKGDKMRICVFGTGAIGGLIAARLALTGEHVTVIGRGAHFDAIKAKGLALRWQDGAAQTAAVSAADGADAAGKQDLVVLAVKAHSLEFAALDIQPLLGSGTIVMTIQNGIPWWYFQRHGGALEGTRLRSLDPNGTLAKAIHPDRIIGCAVYLAAEVVAPGAIQHIGGNRFPLGEIGGEVTSRAQAIAAMLVNGGLQASAIPDIRAEIWLKALGTLSLNPISALTNATMVEICRSPDTRRLVIKMMEEGKEIAAKLGIELRQTIEQRLASAEGVGQHKTSMLQDLQAGRPLEIEALMGTVLEMARLTDTQAPTIAAVHTLTVLLDKTRRRDDAAAGEA